MALIFCDGLDSYASASDIVDKWNSNTGMTFVSNGGRFGGGVVQTPFTRQMLKAFPTALAAGSVVGIGFSYMMSGGVPTGDVGIIGGPSGYWLSVQASTGKLKAVEYGAPSTVYFTGGTNVCDGQWHWIELWVTLQTSATGALQAWVDGVSQGSASSVATLSSTSFLPLPSIGINTSANTNTHNFDDFIVWDNTGTTFNSAPLGPQRISTLNPNADGDLTQFTPSVAGSHYSCVNGGYGATTYVSDTSTGNVDLYKYPSLAYSPPSVLAVVANYWGQDPGTVSANLIAKLKTGGTVATGSTFALSLGANKLFQNPFYTDAGSAAWTATSVNAMQVGVGD